MAEEKELAIESSLKSNKAVTLKDADLNKTFPEKCASKATSASFLTAALIRERFIPSYIPLNLVCKGNNPFYGNKRRCNIYPDEREWNG